MTVDEFNKVRKAVMDQLGHFQQVEQGNKISPYNMSGLLNAIAAAMDQHRPFSEGTREG